MYKILRIICCIISALLLAACVFIFVYLGFVWGLSSLIVAGLFFLLTLFFKNKQEEQENLINPPEPKGDFITGPVRKNTENVDKNNDNEQNSNTN